MLVSEVTIVIVANLDICGCNEFKDCLIFSSYILLEVRYGEEG
jgi:hypothetical protein